MALRMEQVAEVCRLYAQGWSISAIAVHCGLDRKTVRKYLEQESFSPTPPSPVARPSKLDPFKAEIPQWLAEDATVRYTQRHTAVRIWERLRAAHPETFTCSYNVVQRYVHQLRRQAASEHGALELVWHPGEAQVDFGAADGWTAEGQALVFHYLVVTFPYSHRGWVQAFRGETAECLVQGLQDIFQACGGVPRRLVFDQASGVGKRWGETLRLTELFGRFPAHYGFAVTLGNPYAGHEKGNVEHCVGTWRRHALVPPPVIADWAAFNADLLRQCTARQSRTHYKKGVPLATLWAEDHAACLALPRAPFAPVRYTRVRTDGYGKFCLDGVHWYSTAPEYAGQEVLVAIGAQTVIPLTPAGRPIVTHARPFGTTRTDSVDARTTVPR